MINGQKKGLIQIRPFLRLEIGYAAYVSYFQVQFVFMIRNFFQRTVVDIPEEAVLSHPKFAKARTATPPLKIQYLSSAVSSGRRPLELHAGQFLSVTIENVAMHEREGHPVSDPTSLPLMMYSLSAKGKGSTLLVFVRSIL